MSTRSLGDKELRELLSHIYQPLSKKVPLFAPRKKVIVIAGPTASGKTALSLRIAELLGGEIVSADSMQVYRGMDIGTAKVSDEEKKRAPHHLIDVVDVAHEFNVAKYFELANERLKSISYRGKVPIVVGGSGFYIESLMFGPPAGPPSNPEVRARIEKQMDDFGCEALYEQIQLLDPEYAKTITEKDRHKVIRALEIMTISERKVSDFPRRAQMRNDEYDFRLWFIYYPKEILYPKIENRCEQMIAEGFVKEVESLVDQGIYDNKSASNAIGYKQCLAFLKSKRQAEDYQEFLYEFKKASRNYAKRQFTWFRKEPGFRHLDLSKMSQDSALEQILQDYEQS